MKPSAKRKMETRGEIVMRIRIEKKNPQKIVFLGILEGPVFKFLSKVLF
jgi:hypothetical protein